MLGMAAASSAITIEKSRRYPLSLKEFPVPYQ